MIPIKRTGLKVSLQNLGFKRGFQNFRLTELLDFKSFFWVRKGNSKWTSLQAPTVKIKSLKYSEV